MASRRQLRQLAVLVLAALVVFACGHHVPELDAGPRPMAPPPAKAPPFDPHFEHVETPKDIRTQAEIDAAACTGAMDTRWRCKGAAAPVPAFAWVPGQKPGAPKAMSFGGPSTPIIPAAWTVPHWVFDEQNVSGVCSDYNACTTSAHPCCTWQEIAVHRLGCGNERGCVRIRQTSDATLLSSVTGSLDPIYASFAVENGGSFTFTAALPTPTTVSTITGITNWSGCIGAHVQDAVGTIGTHLAFVQDLTSGGGATTTSMWCNEFSSAHTCQNTIPMTAVTPPPTALQTPGLWTGSTGGAGTLTIGDTYKMYASMLTVDVPEAYPVVGEYTGATPTNGIFFYHLQVLDPSGTPGVSPFTWGPGVVLYESRLDRIANLIGTSTKEDGCVNCLVNGGITGGRLSTGHFWHMLGGEITSGGSIINVTGLGVALDGFVMQENPATFAQGVSMGLIQGAFSTVTLKQDSTLGAISPGYAAVANGVLGCFSSATVNVSGSGSLLYDASHGGATGVIIGAPTLEINGSTTAESHSGTSPVVVTAGITINDANLDGAASTTAFGGSAYWRDGFIGNL